MLEQLNRNECPICKQVFSVRSELKTHAVDAHLQKTEYQCQICLLTFNWKCALEAHLQVAHASERKLYPCSMCDKKFALASYMNTHIKAVHLNVKDVKCLECPKCFTTKHKLKLHVEYVHRGVKQKYNYFCSSCGKGCRCPSALRRHIQSVHDKKKECIPILKKYACTTCGKVFSKSQYLINHMALIHQVYKGGNIPWIARKHKCDRCGCYLKGPFSYRNHMKDMHSDKDFPCSLCDRSFTNARRLHRHIVSIHEGKREFKCPLCQSSFNFKADLAIHTKAVHGEKKHPCYLCENHSQQRLKFSFIY